MKKDTVLDLVRVLSQEVFVEGTELQSVTTDIIGAERDLDGRATEINVRIVFKS